MVGKKQLAELGYEAEEYTEIFRQFRQWYKSQKDFDAIESYYWFGCIKLAKEKNLSLGNLFNLILGKLHRLDVDADGTERCVFSVLAAYFLTQQPKIISSRYRPINMTEQEKVIPDQKDDFLSGAYFPLDTLDIKIMMEETSEEYVDDILLYSYQDAVSEPKKEKINEISAQSPERTGNVLTGFFLRQKNKQRKKEEQKIQEVFEKKLLDLSSEQIDFISKKMEEGYYERDLLVMMEPALTVEKMEAICRLLKTKGREKRV